MEQLKNAIQYSDYLLEIAKFAGLKDAYLYLKEKAHNVVSEILNDDNNLKNNLVELATVSKSMKFVGELRIEEFDKNQKRLIAIDHTFFDMEIGCGNLHTMLNLENYFNPNAKNKIVYSVFVYSKDRQDASFQSEVNLVDHSQFELPDNTVYRHLPVLYRLATYDSALLFLREISKRKYPTILNPEIVSLRNKIIPYK